MIYVVTGREVQIKKKDKKNLGEVESAVLKGNTEVYDVRFHAEKVVRIKIDTCLLMSFNMEQKLLL